MNELDQQLKCLLLTEREPDLPAGFVDQTVDVMLGGRSAALSLTNGHSHALRWADRHRWMLVLALAASLFVAWQWGQYRAAADDELMSVDTLSMSSLLVL